MYPRALAEGAFSLGSSGGGGGGSAPCCALSVGVTLAPDGALDGYEVTPSLVRVTAALTYDEADADLALGPGGCAHAPLQDLYEAARLRKAWRLASGAIEIDTPEVQGRGRAPCCAAARSPGWQGGVFGTALRRPPQPACPHHVPACPRAPRQAKMHVPAGDLSARTPTVSISRISQWESAARTAVAEMMILAGEAAGARPGGGGRGARGRACVRGPPAARTRPHPRGARAPTHDPSAAAPAPRQGALARLPGCRCPTAARRRPSCRPPTSWRPCPTAPAAALRCGAA